MNGFPVRAVALGAILDGCVGAVAGLVIGLAAHPATAWFAVLELGAPSAVLGAAAGGLVGAVQLLRSGARRPHGT